jgi:hypothetical protein
MNSILAKYFSGGEIKGDEMERDVEKNEVSAEFWWRNLRKMRPL